MNEITLLREGGPESPALSPAARSAARAALLTEIQRSTTVADRLRSRLPRRRTALRIGAGVTVAAAAWTAAVFVTGPGEPGQVTSPRNGITLVATEELTFPLSLDPAPTGMTPSFTGGEEDRGAIAGYRSADGLARFSIYVTPEAPTWLDDAYGDPYVVTGTGTVTVDGVPGEYAEISVENMCDDTGCRDRSLVDLVWERTPGQWVHLQGEGPYGDVAAAVAVGESLVDRPQPVTLQVGLAPAGWSVADWHDSRDLTLRNDADRAQFLSVQVAPPFPAGSPADNGSVDQRIGSVTAIDPVIETAVGGRPARMVHAHDYMDEDLRFWLLAWEDPDGTLYAVQAPEDFTADDVLAIAEQVTYTR